MLFSIVTACYNCADCLRETLDSVLVQACLDYELLVVDGGSTDGTLDIIREYEPKFAGRMRWRSEPDRGVYDAMNKGVAQATGAYVNFLNAGDHFEPNTLDIIREGIAAHPGQDIYYGFTRTFDVRGERAITRVHYQMVPDGIMLNHQAVWYARELFGRFGNYDLLYRIRADYDHLLTLYEGGVRFCPLEGVVVNYRHEGLSRSAIGNGQFKREEEDIFYRHGRLSEAEYRAIRRGRWLGELRERAKGWFRRLLARVP